MPARDATLTSVTLGLVVFLETFRAWLASIVFIWGETGETTAFTYGALALGPFVLVALMLPSLGRRSARMGFLGMLGLVVARLVLQGSDGGALQLWTSGIGTLFGFTWLVSLSRVPSAASLGLVLGTTADTVLHAVLRSNDLVWRRGTIPWLAVLVIVVYALLAAGRAARVETEPQAPGRPWLVLASLLTLHGIVTGVPSRLQALTAWPEAIAVGVLLTAHAIGVLLAIGAARSRPRGLGVLAAVATFVGIALATASTSSIAVGVGTPLAVIGLHPALVYVLSAPGAGAPQRRTKTAFAGVLLAFVFSFGFYMPYDIALPFPNAVFLIAAAALVALFALVARPTVTDPYLVATPSPAPAWKLAVLVGVATLLVAVRTPGSRAIGGEGYPLRVVLYNVHLGFATDGRFDVDALADVVEAERPDVLVLNEVGRGWLIAGGTDVLPGIAERVGLPWAYEPAIDPVNGNAILSRYPLSEVSNHPLPDAGVVPLRAAMTAVVHVGDGRELGIVATHVHNVDDEPEPRRAQIEVVADLAAGIAEGGRPTLVVGDLNAEWDAPELAPLRDAGFDDLTDEGIATFSSAEPTRHIDHIAATSQVMGSQLSVPRSLASDHLAVGVTILVRR